jgi:hypothetical protein
MLVQTVAALAAEYVPAPQSAQVEDTTAPTAAENLPATQSVQTVAALASEYFPASQLSHAVLTPAVALYFPASQLAQIVAPALRGKAPSPSPSLRGKAGAMVPAPQSKQAAGLVCAVKPEYLPAQSQLRTAAKQY